MSERPTGTISFLFTDIEGSSRLWERNPGRMGASLARHDAILREAAAAFSGWVFKTIGDAFCVAFHTVSDALGAAAESQRVLWNEPWGEGGALRVRMAIHTGEAELRDDDYFGTTLNRIARMLAAGHGGQTLLSMASAGLLTAMPAGVSLRDLGERRLKDLKRPERILQMVVDGLPSDFPNLRSIEGIPNNLPVQLTSFVGREEILEHVKQQLDSTPLLTLSGTGGTGKTRLALQVAAEVLESFPDGVWLVELATVSNPDLVLESVASALNVREESERPLLATVLNFLRGKKVLLLLDNCEHLHEACAQLSASLLRASPQLKILATSRHSLGIAGEHTWNVPPLGMPDERRLDKDSDGLIEEIMEFEAAKLFIDRARMVQPTLALTKENALAIARICWRLDGIPLAIELAAARVRVLKIEQIAERLSDRFRLLTGGSRDGLPHQQTLKALIDWSYDLLTEPEKILLRRLGVFVGGRTLEAVEAICSGDGLETYEMLDLLSQLLDKSLVSIEESGGGETRYTLLESVWHYSRDLLAASGEGKILRERHLKYYLDFAEAASEKLVGPDQAYWMARVNDERYNLRFALQWSIENESAVEASLRMAGALSRFWEVRSYLKEAREFFAAVLARPATAEFPLARATALVGAGRIAWCRDDNTEARNFYQEVLSILEKTPEPVMQGLTLSFLGFVERSEENNALATELFEKSLALGRELDSPQIISVALSGLGTVVSDTGEYEKARALKEESLRIYRGIGDKWIIGLIQWGVARVAIAQLDFPAARTALEEWVQISRELKNDWLLPYVLEAFGDLEIAQGRHAQAALLFGSADVQREKLGLALAPADRVVYEDSRRRMMEALDPSLFSEAWNKGRATKPWDAIAVATGG
jgi:predicted ATPase/class 3 adenylate cyclase